MSWKSALLTAMVGVPLVAGPALAQVHDAPATSGKPAADNKNAPMGGGNGTGSPAMGSGVSSDGSGGKK